MYPVTHSITSRPAPLLWPTSPRTATSGASRFQHDRSFFCRQSMEKIRLSIRVWIINAGRRGNRANAAEPSDVKSAQRPRKRGFTANVSPGVRLPSISGAGSDLRGWMTADSLTSSVNLRFLSANSSRKQHDDAALRSASPLERPRSEAALPTTKPRNTPQTTAGRPPKLANSLRLDTRLSLARSLHRKAEPVSTFTNLSNS